MTVLLDRALCRITNTFLPVPLGRYVIITNKTQDEISVGVQLNAEFFEIKRSSSGQTVSFQTKIDVFNGSLCTKVFTSNVTYSVSHVHKTIFDRVYFYFNEPDNFCPIYYLSYVCENN